MFNIQLCLLTWICGLYIISFLIYNECSCIQDEEDDDEPHIKEKKRRKKKKKIKKEEEEEEEDIMAGICPYRALSFSLVLSDINTKLALNNPSFA